MKHVSGVHGTVIGLKPLDPQSEVVRELLIKADLTLPAAARLLDIRLHVLRGYCSGARVPRVLILALERLADMQDQIHGSPRRSEGRQQ